MKSLAVNLPDDLYERAQRRAAEQGESLSQQVANYLERYAGGAAPEEENGQRECADAVSRLFAALDVGRNVVSVASWSREELYDRPVLH
jgi:hypothetical protein